MWEGKQLCDSCQVKGRDCRKCLWRKIVRIDTLASEEDAILQSVRNFLVGFEICSLE